FRFSYKAQ
ncbi:unnamed protein product, partial [Allacma fusca]